MFEDSLIESGGKLKTKRGATTLFSFVLQMILLGVLILIPLLYTEALPKQQLMTSNPHQDPSENTDDQGRRGSSADELDGGCCRGRPGWRTWRTNGWRDRRHHKLHPGFCS